MFLKVSTSCAADMWPGSRSANSLTIGKLSVWSAASCSPPPPPPPPQAATVEIAPSATARERNTENRLIPPPAKHGSRRAHQNGSAFLDFHRPLPGVPRGESAPATDLPHPSKPWDGPATPRSVLNFASP